MKKLSQLIVIPKAPPDIVFSHPGKDVIDTPIKRSPYAQGNISHERRKQKLGVFRLVGFFRDMDRDDTWELLKDK